MPWNWQSNRARPAKRGERVVDVDTVEQALQRQARYDRLGNAHYDTISAFIKSIRASDPNAALYYLARMIDAGEDPMFIARRPHSIPPRKMSGWATPALCRWRWQRSRRSTSSACRRDASRSPRPTVYLATSQKSNSAYLGIDKALKDVRSSRDEPVPMHLRNAPTRLMSELGYSEGYLYPHDYPDHFVESGKPSGKITRPPILRARRTGSRKADGRPSQTLVVATGTHHPPNKPDDSNQ